MALSASEEIAARRAKYAKLEYSVDSDGRSIGVSRLRPAEQIRIQEWTPGLDGTTTVVDEDPKSNTYRKTFEIPKRTPMILAASVREIDGVKIPFPKNRSELDSIIDRLDNEGLEAASKALIKFDVQEAGEGEKPLTPEEQAKN